MANIVGHEFHRRVGFVDIYLMYFCLLCHIRLLYIGYSKVKLSLNQVVFLYRLTLSKTPFFRGGIQTAKPDRACLLSLSVLYLTCAGEKVF